MADGSFFPALPYPAMSPRAVRITAAVFSIVVLLFAGRWLAGLAADRWWAERLSPGAAQFVTDWAILRLLLEAAGTVTACTWFVGNLLLGRTIA